MTPTFRQRGGFTLIEFLIALGLSTLLMAAIGSTLYLLNRSSDVGRQAVSEARLVRALFRVIETDLRSVAFTEPDLSADEDLYADETGSSSSGSSTSDDDSIVIEDTDVTQSATSFGIYGEPTFLQFTASTPIIPTGETVDATDFFTNDTPSEEDELAKRSRVVISYFLGGAATNSSSTSTSSTVSEPGLVRLVEQAESDDALSVTLEEKLLSGEVTGLAFRYFDGVAWTETWDSTEFASLPAAIEIVIGLEQGVDAAYQDLDPTVQSVNSKEYRYVVPIPRGIEQAYQLVEE